MFQSWSLANQNPQGVRLRRKNQTICEICALCEICGLSFFIFSACAGAGKRSSGACTALCSQKRSTYLEILEDVVPLHDMEMSIRAERQPQAVVLVSEDELLN